MATSQTDAQLEARMVEIERKVAALQKEFAQFLKNKMSKVND